MDKTPFFVSIITMSTRPPPPVQAFDFGRIAIARFRFEKIAALRLVRELTSEWVLYHSLGEGFRLAANETTHQMTPTNLYLIAPHTRYDLWMENPLVEPNDPDFFVRMSTVTEEEDLGALQAAGYGLWLFAHFSVQFEDEAVCPGIYPVAANEELQPLISRAISILRASPCQVHFRPSHSAMFAALLAGCVGRLPEEAWVRLTTDPRIRRALRKIREELGGDLTTPALARAAGLSPNRFTELFRMATGMTPCEAVRAERVAQAQRLLSHSHQRIDEIAESCGFADRYHFSRVFKRVTGFASAQYRKRSKPAAPAESKRDWE